ncbi:MAG TPA: formylglycine-generating enzyme family protein [Pyrinomonadaceae bacterium]
MGMEFAYIPAGTFMMGSSDAEVQAAYENLRLYSTAAKLEWFIPEKPKHQVMIREGFYMGRYEVTQAQWQKVMGDNPSNFKACNQCPVENISWNETQEFIRRMNARGDGYKYRLPTEAEWEYACRAGTTTAFAFGDSLSSEQANFDGNQPYGGAAKRTYRYKTTPVGSFQPNAWGLYDMHGNVWEWCEDIWHQNYNGAPADGSAWLSGGNLSRRVLRGGSWYYGAYSLRSADRGWFTPVTSLTNFGFRVVASAR